MTFLTLIRVLVNIPMILLRDICVLVPASLRALKRSDTDSFSISLEDLQAGLALVKPSAMKEVALEIPKVRQGILRYHVVVLCCMPTSRVGYLMQQGITVKLHSYL